MEGTRQAQPMPGTDRRFRDQPDTGDESSAEVAFRAEGPLEVNMTDEPGGDPYNHTGRFRRMFR
jgi:hypothetical protein